MWRRVQVWQPLRDLRNTSPTGLGCTGRRGRQTQRRRVELPGSKVLFTAFSTFHHQIQLFSSLGELSSVQLTAGRVMAPGSPAFLAGRPLQTSGAIHCCHWPLQVQLSPAEGLWTRELMRQRLDHCYCTSKGANWSISQRPWGKWDQLCASLQKPEVSQTKSHG